MDLLDFMDGFFDDITDKINLFGREGGIHRQRELAIGHIIRLGQNRTIVLVNGEPMDSGIMNTGLDAHSVDVLANLVAALLIPIFQDHREDVIGHELRIVSKRNDKFFNLGETVHILFPHGKAFLQSPGSFFNCSMAMAARISSMR